MPLRAVAGRPRGYLLNSQATTLPHGLAQADEPEVLAGWWRRLFDSSDEAQLVCRESGEVIRLNRRAARLFDCDPSADGPELCLADLLGAEVASMLAPSLLGDSPLPEVRSDLMLRREGKPALLAELTIAHLGDACCLVTVRDVGRRYRMETHVQRLVTAMDSTPDVIYLTDTDGKITFVNCAFQTTTGYSIEESLNRPLSFLRAPTEAARITEYSSRLAVGLEWRGELTNRCRDGRTYPVDVTFTPVYTPRGELLGHAGYERDISAQRQLQRELELRHDFVRSIINSIDAAIYTLDRDFCLTDVNDGWQKMPPVHGWLELSGAPLPGKPLLDYVPNETRRRELRDILTGVLRTREPRELQATSEDGRRWGIKISPWTHAGLVKGLTYAVTDQTSVHRLQEQLFQRQKMETMGCLAAGVAHDFNNLIQVILGNTGLLLLEKQLPSVWLNGLEQIDSAAKRAADITRQLLNFTGSKPEREVVFEVNHFLKDAVQMASRSIHSRVNLVVEQAPRALHVKMDATRAHQLVLNLCINAQDAMPNGGVLTVSATPVELTAQQSALAGKPVGTSFVRCSIADTGTGISPEDLGRIFDAFFTTKAPGKGTGLGLSIVHTVAKEAGGFVEVVSELGRGTTFHVFLPEAEAQAAEAPKETPKSAKRGCGRVLIVDDEESIRTFTQRLLRSNGFETALADDGENALRMLETGACKPDLILTDYHMPNMTGLELIRQARLLKPELKFVLVSGYLDDDTRQMVECDLRARILNKPYQLEEAVNLLIEMLTPPATPA